jgi:hypothetical protein
MLSSALMLFFALTPSPSEARLQPLSPAQCPNPGLTPTLLSAVGPESSDSNTPVPGSSVSLASLGELYLICQSAGQDRSLKGLSISTLRAAGVSLSSDPDPVVLPFEKLKATGHSYYRSVPLYGNVFVSRMFCPGCSTQSTSHSFKIRLLRKFSLFGSSYHDYREIPFSMNYREDLRQYAAERGGTPFQLAISYPGSWGVDKIAFAQCKSADPTACLRDPKGTLVVTEVLNLGSQKSVSVD